MTITPSAPIDEQLMAARLSFGEGLRRWRRVNSWSQDTPETWARAAGFTAIYNSQQSNLERGLSSHPGPKVFLGLSQINQRIADQDWGLPDSNRLCSRLQRAIAIRHDDGTPWGVGDFYACFVGALNWPSLHYHNATPLMKLLDNSMIDINSLKGALLINENGAEFICDGVSLNISTGTVMIGVSPLPLQDDNTSWLPITDIKDWSVQLSA